MGASVKTYSLIVILVFLVFPGVAATQERPENFFRVNQSETVAPQQAFDRNHGYFKILVHDTNIFADRNLNRPLLDWFRNQVSPQRRAVANIRVVIGSGPERVVSSTNFAEIYDEFASDNRRARYIFRERVSTSGLNLLNTSRVPELSAPRFHIGYYGLVEDRQGGGLTSTINSLLPVIMAPKIGTAINVIDEAVSAYDKITTYLYDNTGNGRLFAGAVTDDPFANGSVFSQSGFWVLSHDLVDQQNSLIVRRDNNGYHRLYYAQNNQPVVNRTYALIEIRAIPSRVEGPDADVGTLTEVMVQRDAASKSYTNSADRRNAAKAYQDWMLKYAQRELTVPDIARLALRVVVQGIEQECSRNLFVNAAECSEQKLSELRGTIPVNTNAETAIRELVTTQDTLRTLEQKETLLALAGFLRADGSLDQGRIVSGMSASSILTAGPDGLTQQFTRLRPQQLPGSFENNLSREFSLSREQRIQLELQTIQRETLGQ